MPRNGVGYAALGYREWKDSHTGANKCVCPSLSLHQEEKAVLTMHQLCNVAQYVEHLKQRQADTVFISEVHSADARLEVVPANQIVARQR